MSEDYVEAQRRPPLDFPRRHGGNSKELHTRFRDPPRVSFFKFGIWIYCQALDDPLAAAGAAAVGAPQVSEATQGIELFQRSGGFGQPQCE